MATATDAAASHHERRGREKLGERRVRGNGGEDAEPGEHRYRMGAVVRSWRSSSWSWLAAPLRLAAASRSGRAARSGRAPADPPPPLPAPATAATDAADVLGECGWVVDTPPAGLPTIPAPVSPDPARGAGGGPASPSSGPPGVRPPEAFRRPGRRPRPPAAAVVGASARRPQVGGQPRRDPPGASVVPASVVPAGRRPPPGRAESGPLSPAWAPAPPRPGGASGPARPRWPMAAVGAAWVGLAASWLTDPVLRLVDVLTFVAMLALATLALTAARRRGARSRGHLVEIWTLPVVLLLPPAYALAVHFPLRLLVADRTGPPGDGSLAAVRPGRGEGVALAGSAGERAVPAAVTEAGTRTPSWGQGRARQVYKAAALGVAGATASWLHALLAPADDPYTAHSLVGSPARIAAIGVAVLGYALARRILLAAPWPTGPARSTLPMSPMSPMSPHAGGPGSGCARGTGDAHEAAANRIPSPYGLTAAAGAPPGRDWSVGGGWLGWWRVPVSVTGVGMPGRRRGARGPSVRVEVAELCSGVAIAALWAANPLLMLAAVPPALLLAGSLPPDELLAAARTDPKTRLANAAWWREVAEAELARARRAGRPLSVLLVDIDHFKQVNDRHGHLFGDTVLVAVADALRAATRPWDLVGRFGGEEFVVLLVDVDLRTAAEIAERIRRQVAATRCPLDGPAASRSYGGDGDLGQVGVTVSVGAAACEPPASLASALEAADAALYRAKAAGRNRVLLAVPAGEQAGAVTSAGASAGKEAPASAADAAPAVPAQVTQKD